MQQAVRDEILRTVPMLRRLPRHVDRAFTHARARRPPRAREPLPDDARRHAVRDHAREPRSCSRSSSGTIGLLSVGLIAIEGGPPFTGNTSLFQVFGYFGLFCATVLAMRVIVAVLRDRTN